MLGVDLNEYAIFEKLERGEKIEEKEYSKLIKVYIKLLFKEYNSETVVDVDSLTIREKVIEFFVSNVDSEFNRIHWIGFIDTYVSKVKRDVMKNKENATRLLKITEIDVTVAEKEFIQSIKNKCKRRMVFTLLVYSKIFKAITGKDDGYIYVENKHLFKESKLYNSCRTDDIRNTFIFELYKEGIVSPPENWSTNTTPIIVNIQNIIKDKETGEVAFTITDLKDECCIFSCLINIDNEKWEVCPDCNGYFKVTGNGRRRIRCTKCAKKAELEQNKARRKRA